METTKASFICSGEILRTWKHLDSKRYSNSFSHFFPRIFIIFCLYEKRSSKTLCSKFHRFPFQMSTDRTNFLKAVRATASADHFSFVRHSTDRSTRRACATCWRACVSFSFYFRNRRASRSIESADQRFVKRGLILGVLGVFRGQ